MAYRGQIVEIPLGPDGLTGNKNLTQIPATYLVEALNIAYDQGTLRKEGGALHYNPTVIPGALTIHAGWDHYTNALAQRMVVALSDGTLRKDSGSGTFATTLKSGLTCTNAFFVEGGKENAGNNRKLFVFTGLDAVQVLADDNATTTGLALEPADWTGSSQPSFGCIHEGRLWAGGNLNDPHRMYYSTTANHADFTGAGSGSLSVYPGESQKLVACMSVKGLLLCWKYPKGIYIIDTSDPTVANWRSSDKVTSTVGGVGPHAMVMTEDDVVFLDAMGALQLLSAVQAFGSIGGESLSYQTGMDPLLRSIMSVPLLSRARAIYYVAKREVHFAFASMSAGLSGPNDRRLVLDVGIPGKIRYRLSDRDTCPGLWMRKDALGVLRPTVGDNAGFVWLLDQPIRSKQDSGYLGRWKTAPTDLAYVDPALQAEYKNVEFLELFYEGLGNWVLNIDVELDDRITSRLLFTQGVTGFVLDVSRLDVDVLGEGGVLSTRKRIAGRGKRISLRGHTSGPGQDFSLTKALLSFTPGGTD